MHVLMSTLVLIQGGPSTDLWGSLCGPLSLLVLCPVDSSCLVFLVSQLDFLNSGSPLGSAWVPCAYGAAWSSPGSVVGDCRAQPVCFLSLTDPFASPPRVQCFEHYCSVLFSSFVSCFDCFRREGKSGLCYSVLVGSRSPYISLNVSPLSALFCNSRDGSPDCSLRTLDVCLSHSPPFSFSVMSGAVSRWIFLIQQIELSAVSLCTASV